LTNKIRSFVSRKIENDEVLFIAENVKVLEYRIRIEILSDAAFSNDLIISYSEFAKYFESIDPEIVYSELENIDSILNIPGKGFYFTNPKFPKLNQEMIVAIIKIKK
jgi:hypothetical protein